MKFRPMLECLVERIVPDANPGMAPDPNQPPANPGPNQNNGPTPLEILEYNEIKERLQAAEDQMDVYFSNMFKAWTVYNSWYDYRQAHLDRLAAELAKPANQRDQQLIDQCNANIARANANMAAAKVLYDEAKTKYEQAWMDYANIYDELENFYNDLVNRYGEQKVDDAGLNLGERMEPSTLRLNDNNIA